MRNELFVMWHFQIVMSCPTSSSIHHSDATGGNRKHTCSGEWWGARRIPWSRPRGTKKTPSPFCPQYLQWRCSWVSVTTHCDHKGCTQPQTAVRSLSNTMCSVMDINHLDIQDRPYKIMYKWKPSWNSNTSNFLLLLRHWISLPDKYHIPQ